MTSDETARPIALDPLQVGDDVVAAVLGALQNVATDYEADCIEKLACAVGFWWKCPLCGWVNTKTQTE